MKKVLMGLLIIVSFAMVLATASCSLEDIIGLLPIEGTETGEPTPTENLPSNDPTGSQEEVKETKIEKLGKEKGYEVELKIDNSESSFRFGRKDNTYWYETIGEDSSAIAYDVKANGDVLCYTKEDGEWKYEGFVDKDTVDYTAFNAYQTLLVEPDISGLTKEASKTVAGRNCDVYSMSATVISANAKVVYYVDHEYGILLKYTLEGKGIEGSSATLTYEITKFVVNPSKPSLPEPADYKNSNPENGQSWDLFKTYGLTELVPSGYSSIFSLLSNESDDDYSYTFKFADLTEDQVKAKFAELVTAYDRILKAKGDNGKIYQKWEWDKDDLEEISAFVTGYYDDDFEADGAILVGDTLYWVTLSYNDYYGPAISVQVRRYSYAD